MLNTDVIIEKATEIRKQMRDELQVEMKNVFNQFWELNPGINAVVWTQYAPYFNDGDLCTFSVYDAYFTNVSADEVVSNSTSFAWGEYDGETENGVTFWASEYSYQRAFEKVPELEYQVNTESLAQLSKFLCSGVMEDVMKDTFGEDSLVVATRDGFHTMGYEHD